MKRKFSLSQLLCSIVCAAFGLICVIPFILVLSISLTPDRLIGIYGYQLIPHNATIEAYRYILGSATSLSRSYLVTIFVTVAGTLGSLLIVSMLAYPLSRQEVKYRNKVSMFVFITMLFSGGLVPTFILYTRYLKIDNTILVLILPYLVSAWNVMLMKNFFLSDVPASLVESARIDGSSEVRTFFSIVVPISKPIFATVGLFVALQYWNDWWLALMYIEDKALSPLQYTLQTMLLNMQIMQSDTQLFKDNLKDIPTESARMAMCIFSIGPIILAYPFLQKYIVKGLTVGAVKG